MKSLIYSIVTLRFTCLCFWTGFGVREGFHWIRSAILTRPDLSTAREDLSGPVSDNFPTISGLFIFGLSTFFEKIDPVRPLGPKPLGRSGRILILLL